MASMNTICTMPVSMPLRTTRPHVLDFSATEMETFMAELGEPRYRGRQLFKWIYQKGVFDFSMMTDFPKKFREKLAGKLGSTLNLPEKRQLSKDGTQKFLFRLHDGKAVETVLIPGRDHMTLCISSQAGCAQGCTFCFTGRRGFSRNLTTGEILNQFLAIREILRPEIPPSNIVFMGWESLWRITATR